MASKKVFCKDCRHFLVPSDRIANCICNHPKNCVDTWYEPCGERENPNVLNMDNDCGWYEAKNG